MSKISILGLLAALAISLQGCGIYSFTGAAIPPQATTFSINYFPNHAQLVNPTLSQQFTEALKDRFTNQTNLRLTGTGGHLHFEGSIVGYTTQPQTLGGDDRALQNRLTVTVRVKFVNEFQPENDFEQSFARFYDYDSQMSLSDIEATAIDAIVDALVDDIFNRSVVTW